MGKGWNQVRKSASCARISVPVNAGANLAPGCCVFGHLLATNSGVTWRDFRRHGYGIKQERWCRVQFIETLAAIGPRFLAGDRAGDTRPWLVRDHAEATKQLVTKPVAAQQLNASRNQQRDQQQPRQRV